MLPYKLLSFTTAVGCTVLLTLAALAVSAQNVDVTAICPGGDGSRLMKLAPADSHTMEISCEESSDTCRIKHTVTMNEEAGTTLCVTANGAPYTVTVNKAEAVQTRDSKARVENTCTRMVNATNQTPNAEAATFLNDEVRRVWAGTTGSIVTVSVCGNPERDVVVCGSGSVEAAMLGAPQLCGDAGWYQAVYTGTDSRSTNGCSGSAVRLYFTIISVPPNTNEYTIRQLSFGEPVVTSVVNLNGTQQTVTGSDASDVSVRITVDTPNPLEGYFTASQGGSNSPLIGTSRMQPDSCTGYCAFRKDSEARDWLPMSAVCAGATPNCAATTTTTCEARVQLFTESSEDITLPYQTPDGTVRYTLNGQDYVVATTQGSAVPLNGTFVFTQVAADRVTAEGVARDLSRATTLVLQQDEQHKDVVVVRAGGEVVAASSACKFALRSVRGTDRMYSVTNVLGEPTCDLVIGNGVEQRTFHVDTPAKASGARDVENVEPLWDQVDEGGKKNLPLILGLSLGLGIPFVGAAAIIIGLYCCRRRKTCCFAPDSECPAWLTKWSRRATDCCSGNSTDEESAPAENPLKNPSSDSAQASPNPGSTGKSSKKGTKKRSDSSRRGAKSKPPFTIFTTLGSDSSGTANDTKEAPVEPTTPRNSAAPPTNPDSPGAHSLTESPGSAYGDFTCNAMPRAGGTSSSAAARNAPAAKPRVPSPPVALYPGASELPESAGSAYSGLASNATPRTSSTAMPRAGGTSSPAAARNAPAAKPRVPSPPFAFLPDESTLPENAGSEHGVSVHGGSAFGSLASKATPRTSSTAMPRAGGTSSSAAARNAPAAKPRAQPPSFAFLPDESTLPENAGSEHGVSVHGGSAFGSLASIATPRASSTAMPKAGGTSVLAAMKRIPARSFPSEAPAKPSQEPDGVPSVIEGTSLDPKATTNGSPLSQGRNTTNGEPERLSSSSTATMSLQTESETSSDSGTSAVGETESQPTAHSSEKKDDQPVNSPADCDAPDWGDIMDSINSVVSTPDSKLASPGCVEDTQQQQPSRQDALEDPAKRAVSPVKQSGRPEQRDNGAPTDAIPADVSPVDHSGAASDNQRANVVVPKKGTPDPEQPPARSPIPHFTKTTSAVEEYESRHGKLPHFDIASVYLGDPAMGRDATTTLDRKQVLLAPETQKFAYFQYMGCHTFYPDTIYTYKTRYAEPAKPLTDAERTKLLDSIGYPKERGLQAPLVPKPMLKALMERAFSAILTLPFTEQTHAVLYDLVEYFNIQLRDPRRAEARLNGSYDE